MKTLMIDDSSPDTKATPIQVYEQLKTVDMTRMRYYIRKAVKRNYSLDLMAISKEGKEISFWYYNII